MPLMKLIDLQLFKGKIVEVSLFRGLGSRKKVFVFVGLLEDYNAREMFLILRHRQTWVRRPRFDIDKIRVIEQEENKDVKTQT